MQMVARARAHTYLEYERIHYKMRSYRSIVIGLLRISEGAHFMQMRARDTVPV